MKRWIKWVVLGVVVLLIASGILRALAARKAQQEAVAAAASKAEAVVELAATDIVRAQPRELVQGVPIAGTLKAVSSAVVKARVAGELQDLAVREGDTVKAGQVLARVDPTEYAARLKQAREQGASAKAQVDIAQRQFDNNRSLVEQGFISRTALDTSQASLQSAQASYQAARAAADVAQKALDDTVLRSPIAGQVAQRLVQPGERVAVEARIVEVVDLSHIELEATLAPTDAQNVRVGQSATLVVEGSAQPVSATVARINPAAQAGSRAVLAYLSVPRTQGLRHGLFAQGTLDTGRVSALSVPLTAVRTDKPEPYVQVVENNAIVHRAVQLGAQGRVGNETMVAVTGVADQAAVVRGAVGPLREGTQVKQAAAPAPVIAPAASTPKARN